jgi:hypothetical protein
MPRERGTAALSFTARVLLRFLRPTAGPIVRRPIRERLFFVGKSAGCAGELRRTGDILSQLVAPPVDTGPVFGSKPLALAAAEEGSASVEYIVLLSAVSILVSGALLALGESLIERYYLMSALVSLPLP